MLIIVFLLTSVLIAIWFERKVVARMQVRPGPNVHGPFGLLQSLADAMKLLLKEDITVTAADKFVYILAPDDRGVLLAADVRGHPVRARASRSSFTD